jgi:hypothetical protein
MVGLQGTVENLPEKKQANHQKQPTMRNRQPQETANYQKQAIIRCK